MLGDSGERLRGITHTLNRWLTQRTFCTSQFGVILNFVVIESILLVEIQDGHGIGGKYTHLLTGTNLTYS